MIMTSAMRLELTCPICGVGDTRRDFDGEDSYIYHCTNGACRSNGGDVDIELSAARAKIVTLRLRVETNIGYNEMQIDMSKKYRYRSKEVVPLRRILCDNKHGDYPVVTDDISGHLYSHTSSGYNYVRGGDGDHDLIEVKPYEDIPLGTEVLVRNKLWAHNVCVRSPWYRRYFSGLSVRGNPTTWPNGATEWSHDFQPVEWDELKLAEVV